MKELVEFVRNKAASVGAKSVLLQTSRPADVELLRTAAPKIMENNPMLEAVGLSVNPAQKCSALVDALHLPNGIVLHVDAECLCLLGNKHVCYYSTYSGAETTDEHHLIDSVREAVSTPEDLSFEVSACVGSEAFLQRAGLSDGDIMQLQNTRECRSRLSSCMGVQFGISALRKQQDEGDRLGIIVGDTSMEALAAARLLKRVLSKGPEEERLKPVLFYFGPRLDEAKLLNAERVQRYIFISKCKTSSTPWLNRGLQRASGSVKIATLFEFLAQNKRIDFTGCYETELAGCISTLTKWEKELQQSL